MAEFKIPDVGEGISEVDLAALSVSVGDVIEPGMIVAEVETEKAATDVDCPIGGKVVKIHANPGDTLAVGAVLLTIEASDAAASAPAEEAPAAPAAAEPAAAPAGQPAPAAQPAPNPQPAASAPAAPVSPATAPAPAASAVPADDRAPAPAGPATRRLARQLGVDLHTVSGTAAGGRITQEDVKSHVKQIMEGGASASGGGGGYAPPPLPDFTKWGPVEREPMNKISRSAAANLSMCWNVIPHVTQHDLVDITDLEAARRRYSDKAKKTGAPKVTMTAIAMKASVVCLKEFPKFNSSLDPQTNEIVYRKYFNIGCAVDTPNGLLVPVIKDCDQKSVAEIGAELSDVAGRARDRKVTMDEMQGACFTITNLGGIGGTAFTPIVNYPEVAILGMSRGRKELQIVDGEIEERFMLPLSMSYDHRVVNGADAARFVVRLGQLLGDAFNLAATI
jgi:pyruvate dehydrogenase E2 component (dihydrolipoamide acetyltransferase)